ncbi:hypothetical protein SK128_027909 [Halocaridina rubra]|uniref:AAA+ ATPase domain-containing protein n=1 Tax=Halocaridina rubra TaxID=373956 RepID=A0AAN8XEH3_HALRR
MLCTNRDQGSDTGVITALLHLLDGLNATSMDDNHIGILVIGTATNPHILDAALRRPGRISYDITLSSPDKTERVAILSKMLQRVENNILEEDVGLIASRTPGYVGGDLHNVMLEAVMLSEGRLLTLHDLENAVAVIKPMALRNSTAVDHKIPLTDVYGYKALKSKLQESLNLSLSYGHIFEDCGLSPPTRYLIFGPPGCGKSSLIMALSTEFHMSVIRIKRSTVLGKYFGESEQNLTKLFAQAQESSPCIIHFENFEGLAGKTKADDGSSDVEGRIINHLKVQLDGIFRSSGIFIFAETNRPDLLDKDVIRPGRFHEYYFMDLPESEDRLSILQQNLSDVSFSYDLSFPYLAEKTSGFTVAEVLQLCSELEQQIKELGEAEFLSITNVEEVLDSLSPSTSKKMLQKLAKFSDIYYTAQGNK